MLTLCSLFCLKSFSTESTEAPTCLSVRNTVNMNQFSFYIQSVCQICLFHLLLLSPVIGRWSHFVTTSLASLPIVIVEVPFDKEHLWSASSVPKICSTPTRQFCVTRAVAVSTRCHASKCSLGSWLTRML